MSHRKIIPASLILGLAIAACGAVSPQTISQVENTAAAVVLATDTPAPGIETIPAVTQISASSPTETAPAATIPAMLTSIPGIADTLTAVYSTPGAEATIEAQTTSLAATQSVEMSGFSKSLLKECPNPSDPPKQSFADIPVMPQATAGQVVETLIGSYYCFRAPVTVEQMETFYKEQLTSPRWILQSAVNGQMTFIGMSPNGMQILMLVSGPGDKNDLLVAINVTRPVVLPTPKP